MLNVSFMTYSTSNLKWELFFYNTFFNFYNNDLTVPHFLINPL